MDSNPSRLHQKYTDLHRSQEVLNVVRRSKRKQGEPPDNDIDLSKNPEGRIQDYLDYLVESVHEANPERQEKIRRFKQKLCEKYCITDTSQIPESYWTSIQENHRREGRQVPEITAELQKELSEPIISDQKESLDEWIDYLTSPDAKYPDWLKYWAIRSVLTMGRYDKEKQKFTERGSKKTISPFPELNQQALALVVDAMVKKYAKENTHFGYDISEETKQKFLSELNKENFAKLYAIAIEEFKPISEQLLQITDGVWKQYTKGSNPQTLVDSLKHHGTGWCIRGLSTAQRYLTDFDLEVFYSNNEQGEPVVPRLVIVRFPDGRISEFRGVAKKEEHDPHISPVVSSKLAELGSQGEQFRKSKADIDMLDVVYEKTKQKQWLTRQELVFLYEFDAQIEGFGYGCPERVKELRKERKDTGLLEQDMLVIFECEKNQIATTKEQLEHNTTQGIETKVYVGPLFDDMFDAKVYPQLAHIEHIYTSFPERPILKRTIEIGGETKDQLRQRMRQDKITVPKYTQFILDSTDFTTDTQKRPLDTVRLTVEDLGFPNGATFEDICKKADALGLGLCPAEVGPHYRLQYTDQPMYEYLSIGMKPISGPGGDPDVFSLSRRDDGLWLDYGDLQNHWYADDEIVFAPRK